MLMKTDNSKITLYAGLTLVVLGIVAFVVKVPEYYLLLGGGVALVSHNKIRKTTRK